MPINQLQIRDLDTIIKIKDACVMALRKAGIDQWDDIYPDRPTFQEDLISKQLYGYEFDGTIVATITINEFQDKEYEDVNWIWRSKNIGVIHRLMVHPEHWRKGIANKLVAFAENFFSSYSYTAIRLDAFLKNPASLSLYESLGYRFAGEITFPKGRCACFEKSLVMELTSS
jgi:GNAT superfamily N-acetyltransferase